MIPVNKNGFAPVRKTGQTFPTGTGTDGALQKGVEWPDPRFTDNGDGTVTDHLTGLVWLEDANGFGALYWAPAISACNTLNTGEHGLSDGSSEGAWRLPNVNELQSLIDYSNYNKAVPTGHPFDDVRGSTYWTSTTYIDYPDNAWQVNMMSGEVTDISKTSSKYVWPVRDASP